MMRSLMLTLSIASGMFAATIIDFAVPQSLITFDDWKDVPKQEKGYLSLAAGPSGGLMNLTNINAASFAYDTLGLRIRLHPDNTADIITVRLISDGTNSGEFLFTLNDLPAGTELLLPAEKRPPIAASGKMTGRFDPGRITYYQLMGPFQGKGECRFDLIRLESISRLTPPPMRLPPKASEPAAEPKVLFNFKREAFPIAVLKWKDLVKFDGRTTILDAPHGEGVMVLPRTYDLRGYEKGSIAVTIKVFDDNRMSSFKITMADAVGGGAGWTFDIPAKPADNEITVMAKVNAAFEDARDGDRPAIRCDKINQMSLTGSWKAERAHIEFIRIEAVPPSAAIAATKKKPDAAQSSAIVKKPFDSIVPMARNAESPRVTAVCCASPDVLEMVIEAGRVIPPVMTVYVPQEGDIIIPQVAARGGKDRAAMLVRDGVTNRKFFQTPNGGIIATEMQYGGDRLQTELADHPESYGITSPDDSTFAAGVRPTTIFRKAKPIDRNDESKKPINEMPARHTIYLMLPKPLTEGAVYTIDCGNLNIQTPVITFTNDTRHTRANAVHTQQIGYRPGDPFKCGYLSTWLGMSVYTENENGTYPYPAGLSFDIIDNASERTVFTGPVTIAKFASEPEYVFKDMNYNYTDVLRMDFSSLNTPGDYRLYVKGIGCGYPFTIGTNTWENAFRIKMRGLFHQRSGMELGPPYTSFIKPRDHHPDDGYKVYFSTAGGTFAGPPKEFGTDLETNSTGIIASNAWGGWMDAGDWNPRRITHLTTIIPFLALIPRYPEFFARIALSIPKDHPTVPDVMNELLWEMDCFRRLQTPDGGVPFQIESRDPMQSTVSWTEGHISYVAAPDAGSTWYYAAAAARTAMALRCYDKAVAKVYEESAVKAMLWAESRYAEYRAPGTNPPMNWRYVGYRNLAAVDMLCMTGDKRWHAVFMEDSCFTNDRQNSFMYGKYDMQDAAFAYAAAPAALTDPKTRAFAVSSIERMADTEAEYTSGNAWNYANMEKNGPMITGFWTRPTARNSVYAHMLTGDDARLRTVLMSTHFTAGANPDNLVYTTGLGANPVKNALKVDARKTGQACPEGLTVFGMDDIKNFPMSWGYWILPQISQVMVPEFRKWPSPESYCDVAYFIPQNEFTIDQTGEYQLLVWGYLAARENAKK